MDDDSAFGQLDQLLQDPILGVSPTRSHERGASDSHFHQNHQHRRASQSAGFGAGFGDANMMDQPMIFDSFDMELLRRSDHTWDPSTHVHSRHLPSGSYGPQTIGSRQRLKDGDQPVIRPSVPFAQLGFQQFMHEEISNDNSSSPSQFNANPSSPTLKASQRRPSGRPQYHEPHGRLHDQNQTEAPNTYSGSSGFEVSRRSYLRPPHSSLSEEVSQNAPSERPRTIMRGTLPPVIQGIPTISTRNLPDRFRDLFAFPLFNAVQSKCFNTVYNTNDNLVVAAPTGSGKTAIFELAICRLINEIGDNSFKVVYQAPTKSLCAERQRDWQVKFGRLDIQCAELTGDSDHAQIRRVQQATVIITTPEKWDSMTRKWKDHQRLMQMVKLFLIDEVHILKEDRGATLEAVVSRMKSVGSNVRFVALSATVPNSDDIAMWLGRDSNNPQIPAVREQFGEEFRPVKLTRHVVGFQHHPNSNDFAFEKVLNDKLPEIIVKWSHRKPIMVFCFTRSSCIDTAKLLAKWWISQDRQDRCWDAPQDVIRVSDKDLKDMVTAGVAFHHAGLTLPDRQAIENGFLHGTVNVICCTSTLAVGVNLPCHLVIIKNTVSYQRSVAGCKEYSDLEIMQMLGRAGRPQFDTNGIAVIMTRQNRVAHYNKMVSGQEILESRLHRNLIDHLNAEIGLETITSVASAKHWLSGTFLYIRLRQNPDHYKIEDHAAGRNCDERLENICANGIVQLEQHKLVKQSETLQCTEFGDAMARYYVQFETMKTFLSLPAHPKVSEILSVLSQAAEFRDIRFRAGEKSIYKELNKDSGIKYTIAVNLDSAAHKTSLVIQATLGCLDLPAGEPKHAAEFNTAKALIFQHAHRLIRCIVDCQLHMEDGVGVRNALMLSRSLGAQVWDDSPLHMKQLESIGIVAVRKLVAADIKSVEDLIQIDPGRIERALSRHPPFGRQIQEKAKAFPQLRIALKTIGDPSVKRGDHVIVRLKAEVGSLENKIPELFNKAPVYACVLIDTSDGRMIHFVRLSAKKLNDGQDILCSAKLTSSNQRIRALVMCDQIAGTMRHVTVDPNIPASFFPPILEEEKKAEQRFRQPNAANTSKRRTSTDRSRIDYTNVSDDFGDAGISDTDLAAAEVEDFPLIDDLDEETAAQPPAKRQRRTAMKHARDTSNPVQLANGNWACNHACKDKTSCKHPCCQKGLDKKPKPSKSKVSKTITSSSGQRQTQLSLPINNSHQPRITMSSSVREPCSIPDSFHIPTLDLQDSDSKTLPFDYEIRTAPARSELYQGPFKAPEAENGRSSFPEQGDRDVDGGESSIGDYDDLPDMQHLLTQPPPTTVANFWGRGLGIRSSLAPDCMTQSGKYMRRQGTSDGIWDQKIEHVDLSSDLHEDERLNHVGQPYVFNARSRSVVREEPLDKNEFDLAPAADLHTHVLGQNNKPAGDTASSSKYFRHNLAETRSPPDSSFLDKGDLAQGVCNQVGAPRSSKGLSDDGGQDGSATADGIKRWWERHFGTQISSNRG